jgi:hypothetical protein
MSAKRFTLAVIAAAIIAAWWTWWTAPPRPDHSHLPRGPLSLYSEIG